MLISNLQTILIEQDRYDLSSTYLTSWYSVRTPAVALPKLAESVPCMMNNWNDNQLGSETPQISFVMTTADSSFAWL